MAPPQVPPLAPALAEEFAERFRCVFDRPTEFAVDVAAVAEFLGRWRGAVALARRVLREGVEYVVDPDGRVLCTARTFFGRLCDCAGTEAARRARDLHAEASARLLADARAELRRLRDKTYEEVPKTDSVYVNKENAEAHSDRHKFGRAADARRRSSSLNTGSARGSEMIYVRATSNAALVEDVVHAVLKRYHVAREHYQCRVEHTMDVADVACIVVDTLASSYEFISREDLFDRVVANLRAERGRVRSPLQPPRRGRSPLQPPLQPPLQHPLQQPLQPPPQPPCESNAGGRRGRRGRSQVPAEEPPSKRPRN